MNSQRQGPTPTRRPSEWSADKEFKILREDETLKIVDYSEFSVNVKIKG